MGNVRRIIAYWSAVSLPTCVFGREELGRRSGRTTFERAPEILSEETRKPFAASVIASVIALGKSENGCERPKADERTRKRQIARLASLTRKTPVSVGVSRIQRKESLPPSQVRNPGRELLQL